MKAFGLFVFLFFCNISVAQVEGYEKSKIIESIPVKESAGETFQMYLPDSYDPNTLSAIVFIFDPGGNGTNGLKPFITSAERFNYVLVCSNNSRNGPYQQNFDITNRLFSHAFANFNIDEKQIYTAGFSGGSRLACTVAVLTGAIQGVIGCGAGFTFETDKKPSPLSTFSYVGLVGDEDMNYQEMFNVKDWLEKFNVENELFTFEDGHRWPPEEQIERAFKWFELQAYKRNLRDPDPRLIERFYQEDLAIADSLVQVQPFRAVMEYERLMKNYPTHKHIDLVSKKIMTLRNSKAYKNEAKIREEIDSEEYKISERFLNRFRQESSSGESRDNFTWWRKELKKLNDDILKKDNYFTNKMGKRLHSRIRAVAYETSMFQRNGDKLDTVIYCDRLLVQLNPTQPYWLYRLAESYAMNNDAKNTRVNLQMAVDKGFDNIDQIKNNPVFMKLKGNKKLKDFLDGLN